MQATSGKISVRVVPLGGVYTFAEPRPEMQSVSQPDDRCAGVADHVLSRLFRSARQASAPVEQ